MLEPWNDSSILPPPVNMFLCHKKFDVSGLQHACNNISKVLSKQSPLHKESAICSRFIYKYDQKFRHDIGYRNLRKVNTALKKYLTINLLKDVDNFLSALPSQKDDEVYLPTRQMLVYVLLRVVAFAKIMLRVCVCSKQAAIFYLHRIKRGESHWMCLLPFALLCRLWSLAKVLVQHSVSWYTDLYRFVDKLELKGVHFLPENYELPENLEELVDIKNIDNFGKFEWTHKRFTNVDSELLGDENAIFDNIFEFASNINKDDDIDGMLEELRPVIDKCKEILQVPVQTTVDHGEVLSRDSFKALLNKTDKTLPRTGHTHLKVTNIYNLKEFINEEDKLRNESNENSQTNHLSFMQWHSLKTTLLKLCEGQNRKIEKKFQQIWKEKCLDYKL